MNKLMNKSWTKESILPFLNQIGHGIEKEGLRAYGCGQLSSSFHPVALGSKLTHPYITTDYAESLLEFVTPVLDSYQTSEEFLKELHYLVYKAAPNEVVWPVSMPCLLPSDSEIAVADYGESNVGKMKTVYRIGLGHRYGRSMQTIAGIHYNISLPKEWIKQIKPSDMGLIDFTNNLYFHVIRNFRRYNWLITYLYGASPLVDESFLANKDHQLKEILPKSFGLEYATCLRMGGLGYTSSAQESISVCYNKVETYIKSLEQARTTSYPAYTKIGIKDENGYKQLSDCLLQIDNEFYSRIRPKRVRLPGENSLMALHARGVEYLELRLLDVNPFSATGISNQQKEFLTLFVLFCLFEDSPAINSDECRQIESYYKKVVTDGRNPQGDYGQKAIELVEKMASFAKTLNVEIPEEVLLMAKGERKIFSQKLIDEVEASGLSFLDWTINQAKSYKKEILELEMTTSKKQYFTNLANDSMLEQKEIEQSDKIDFDQYLSEYYQKTKLNL